MNKKLGCQIKNHALFLVGMYAFYRRQIKDEGSFDFLGERQAYRDALESMVQNKLIESYNLEKFVIVMDDNCEYGVKDAKFTRVLKTL